MGLSENMKVSEIIEAPGKWNVDLIQQIFLVPDAELILTIPLSPFNHNDSWLWHYNSNGCYTVKSGYNLAIENGVDAPSSSSDALAVWWKAYWAVRVPQKILIFGWKGYHEILPTIKGLLKRNVTTHSNCPLCGFGDDSNAHAIYWCPFSQEVWELHEYPFLVGHKEEIPFNGVLMYSTELLGKNEFARMLMIAWGIWTERNKRTHGQNYRTSQQIKEWIASYYEEVKNSQVPDDGGRRSQVPVSVGQGVIEIHDLTLFVDATISSSQQKVGLGAAIITANKRVQATLSKPLEGTLSVFHAEALALLVGLRWAETVGLPIKLIYSDSLSLIQALTNSAAYQNELGMLLVDIQRVIESFQEAAVDHVNRSFNSVAHDLAKYALRLDDETVWLGENSP